jgi:hypothetical protein
MIVPWPGHEGEIVVTEERQMPGKTDPVEVWIETRRAQYSAIHRPDVITAIQDGTARVATRGDLVMGSWATLDRTMAVARVVAVRGAHVELDAPIEMAAGESYALRWRLFGEDDTVGESIVRPVMTVAGEHRAAVLTGDGDGPPAGAIVHFGRATADSLPLIVAGIEPGENMASVLTMQPHVPLIDDLTDAEVPPPWDGRVGFIAGPDGTAPGVPVFVSIASGVEGTDDHDGLQVALRAGSGVAIARFVVSHRLSGAGEWSEVNVPVASAGTSITGYTAGQTVELRAHAVSLGGTPGEATAIVAVTIGAGDLPIPAALPEASITVTGKAGHAEIVFATGSDPHTSHVQLWRDGEKAGSPIPVSPLGTFGRIDGDSTVVPRLVDPGFDDPDAWLTNTNFVVDAGVASKTPGAAGNIYQIVDLAPGDVLRSIFTVTSRVAGSVRVRGGGWTGGAVSGASRTATGTYLDRITVGAMTGTLFFGARGESDFEGAIDGLKMFKETAACIAQGEHVYELEPLNGDGAAGPRSTPRTVIVS